MKATRHGMVIRLRTDRIEEYRRLHSSVWPDVLRILTDCHVQNYSIFLRPLDDGNHDLFSYFEYAGSDFAADMSRMAADSVTQKWWEVCKPCQEPLTSRLEGEWWSDMPEVFHHD
jgi:L-rhamnose mutarotase